MTGENAHRELEAHLQTYTDAVGAKEAGAPVSLEEARAAKEMLGMVAFQAYVPQCEVPDAFSEQFSRMVTGAASPTHALEALVGGEAIGRLNQVEGRVDPQKHAEVGDNAAATVQR